MGRVGIRESLNQNPRAATLITFAVIFSALAYIGVEIYRNRSTPSNTAPGRAFYTTDEGATTFVDDADRISPIDHAGTPAFRVLVFTCDEGKTRFVACLERLAPESKPDLPKRRDDRADFVAQHSQVRRPNTSTWITASDVSAPELLFPKCKDGSTASPVLPEK